MHPFAKKLSRCKLCCNATPRVKLLWFVRGDHLRICKVCKRCFLKHRLVRLQTPLFGTITFEMENNQTHFYAFEPSCVLNNLCNLREFVRQIASMNQVRRFGLFLSFSSNASVNKLYVRWFMKKTMVQSFIWDSYPFFYQTKKKK